MATEISIAKLSYAGVDYWDRRVFAYSGASDGKIRYLCTVDLLHDGSSPDEVMEQLKSAVGQTGYLYTKSPQTDFEGEPDFAIKLVE